jgi:TM2 domain-containing membrane protein YozV
MNSSDLGSVITCLGGLLILGLFIALVVLLVNRSKQESQRSEQMYNQIMQSIPSDKQMLFVMQYENVKKNSTLAVILALFLGGLGAHKFYMGQIGWGIVYIIFSWTFIPAIIGLIEAFLLPSQIRNYNLQKASEIAAMVGARTNI